MPNKTFLTNKIVNSLLVNQFQVFLTRGSFDVAAKKEFLILIKTLTNVDGLNQDQALSLRAISYFLSAYPLVISIRTNREILSNEIVYSRFQIPVVTPEFFENILKEKAVPEIESAKGRHSVSINTKTLREKRKELGFTLEELSKIIRISKKALYEIENERVNPSIETVKRLESILGINLKNVFRLRPSEPTYLKPRSEFQSKVTKEFSRIGVENSPTYSAPFEIIGKEKFSMIACLSKNSVKIKREANTIKKLSSIFSSKCMFVVKRCESQAIEGIPIVLELELSEIENAKELIELMEERGDS
ncbi:MAG: helix-turn-helix domain-containing protein [Candidatus Aenigmarchaeota archaeon]|nr:helix-turn-helix domain-containing protein [Candidatus Aenigmarchaeota archaeon]